MLKKSFKLTFETFEILHAFPISKVLVFEIALSVEKILVFEQMVIATYVEKMKILDYFMIANGKKCD